MTYIFAIILLVMSVFIDGNIGWLVWGIGFGLLMVEITRGRRE
jgi:hypothetical protein